MQFHVFNSLSTKALESLRIAIVVTSATDAEHPIIYVNPAFETLTGYAREDALGRNCRFLQGSDLDQPVHRVIRAALSKKCAVRGILRNYHKDGSLFYNELFIDPILGADGTVTHFVGCQNKIAEPEKAHILRNGYTGFDRLTEREREVFPLIVNGHTNKSIARELKISPRTSEKHRIAILKKFEAPDLTVLVRYAIALGVPFRSSKDGTGSARD